MKRIIPIIILIIGLTVSYSFAQMGQGRMMGQGMMDTLRQQQMGETPYESAYYPCSQMMGYGGYGMMGPGMMGSGIASPGMMGRHGMMGYGKGHGKSGYNAEAYQKFLNETADLRKELHNKKFEYFEALRNPDAKREAILKIEKGIWDLQWKIYEKSPR